MMALHESTRGLLLNNLLAGLTEYPMDTNREITGISIDSRKTSQGDLFLACHGTNTCGAEYTHDAVKAGAAAIAIEAELACDDQGLDVPVIPVNDLRHRAGIIAARFYGQPAEDLDVIGITGTNGKTSVSHFLAQALAGYKDKTTGLIGTLGYGPFERLHPARNTTPDPITLQSTLSQMRDQGINTAMVEVSSHGLDQGRVSGLRFGIAIFTNLSHEHLDYHGDMDTYAQAKKQLFLSRGLKFAVINSDDEYGRTLLEELSDSLPVIGYGLVDEFPADMTGLRSSVTAVIHNECSDVTDLDINTPWGRGRLCCRVGGRFNAYNLLACLSALCLLDVPFPEALERLSRVSCVPGRMENFGGKGDPLVIVDYAHTPDALENVLSGLRVQCQGRLVCVFGCGGERDKGKRPHMGRLAEQYADQIVLTNDNPRGEDPKAIIQDIIAGINRDEAVLVESDRTRAISAAIRSAAANDIVLIAGKGHETYQEISARRYPFSDRQLVRNLLERKP